MHRKFITLVAAVSLAVTGLSAAPARAQDNNTAGVLAGLAALAILGVAIHHSRNDNDTPTVSQSAPPRGYPIPHRPSSKLQPRPQPRHVARYDLPSKCLRVYGLRDGPKRLLNLHCLKENYRFTNTLPQACRFQFQNRYFGRTGYEPLCLRERGYRIVRG